MHHDDPLGGGGEPGGEEDLLDEADAVGALEETFGEEPPSSAATSPLLLVPPVLPADDEAAVALMDDDEMLGARPKAEVLAWVQRQTRPPAAPEVPAPLAKPAPGEAAAARGGPSGLHGHQLRRRAGPPEGPLGLHTAYTSIPGRHVGSWGGPLERGSLGAKEPRRRRAYCAQSAQLCTVSWAQVVSDLRNNRRTMPLNLDAGCRQVSFKNILSSTH